MTYAGKQKFANEHRSAPLLSKGVNFIQELQVAEIFLIKLVRTQQFSFVTRDPVTVQQIARPSPAVPILDERSQKRPA